MYYNICGLLTNAVWPAIFRCLCEAILYRPCQKKLDNGIFPQEKSEEFFLLFYAWAPSTVQSKQTVERYMKGFFP